MKPRIIITGIAGFVGSNLAADLLGSGYEVVGIDNLEYGLEEQIPAGADFRLLDIRSAELADIFEPDDVVFHLAAKNCISDCQDDPVETASINVTGTVNVFESARKRDVAKVIYAESSAIYEGSTTLPTPESDIAPQSFYAVSKLSSMIFAEAYERWFGLRTTGLRYFNVYGPRQDYRRTIPPVMSAFILKLRRGESPTIYGKGDKRRDFIHVDDVNSFHKLCIHDDRTHNTIFNLGSGQNYSVLDIYKMLTDILDSTVQPSFGQDLPGEAFENKADISLARSLGWEPNVSMRDGLKSMIDYFEKTGIK